MKRREFITLLGGAAVAWPLAARAQQGARRIGVLTYIPADDAEGQARHAAFTQALSQLGWSEGRNLRIDTLLGHCRRCSQTRGRTGRARTRRPPGCDRYDLAVPFGNCGSEVGLDLQFHKFPRM